VQTTETTEVPPTEREVTGTPKFRVHIARTEYLIEKALRLRFNVFNLEMGEGLPESSYEQMDRDRFDACCDHLVVTDQQENVVGTYRLQTGESARANLGYYAQTEFYMFPFDNYRSLMLEAGRACVAKEHRKNLTVLSSLWSGIASYASMVGARYLIGCSSIHGTDEIAALAAYQWFVKNNHLAPEWFRSFPLIGGPPYHCTSTEIVPSIPKLLGLYMTIGAKICGPPYLDYKFGTTDFLTFLDLQSLTPAAKRKFFKEIVLENF
jgi:putative hemolysin